LSVVEDEARPPASALRRRLSDPAVQDDLVAAANEALVTPALFGALSEKGILDEVREPVRPFLESFHQVNRDRNEAFAGQLAEAARAMNAAGIRPLVLKGTRALLENDPRRLGRRVMCDLDLMVPEESAAAACKAVESIGYRKVKSFDAVEHTHEIGDFARPDDFGAIDLHRALTSHYGHRGGRAHCRDLIPPEDVFAAARPARFRDAEILVPDPRHHLLHLILHDQLQGHDHYAARLNVRHLLDIAELLRDMKPAEVRESVAMMRPHGLSSMAVSHLLAAHALFGAPLPASLRLRPWPRLINGARMAAAARPWLAAPQRAVGALAWEFARCRYPLHASVWRVNAWRAARLWSLVRRYRQDMFRQFRRVASRL
jgi:hypothetical protein